MHNRLQLKHVLVTIHLLDSCMNTVPEGKHLQFLIQFDF